MTKGSRKRANPKKVTPEQPVCSTRMPPVLDAFKDFPVKPLAQPNVSMMQGVVQINNKYAQAVKQKVERENVIVQMNNTIKKLQDKTTKPPIMVRVDDYVSKPEYNISKVIKDYKNDIKVLKQSLSIIDDQASHWYDEYRDSLITLYNFIDKVLGANKELKQIRGSRRNLTQEARGKETEKFEEEFNKKVSDLTDEDRKTLKKAVQANTKK